VLPVSGTTGGTTILVVEDETTLRSLLCRCLEKRHHTVFAAKDGAEGLELFRQYADQIHLVVTDLMMPRMDGCELRREIMTLRGDVKFLFISGYAEQIMGQIPVSDGCGFLEKPFLPEELANKVAHLIVGDVAA
jgi:two-component system, cell cycle sensor histidine kinase and response regulator CckA